MHNPNWPRQSIDFISCLGGLHKYEDWQETTTKVIHHLHFFSLADKAYLIKKEDEFTINVIISQPTMDKEVFIEPAFMPILSSIKLPQYYTSENLPECLSPIKNGLHSFSLLPIQEGELRGQFW